MTERRNNHRQRQNDRHQPDAQVTRDATVTLLDACKRAIIVAIAAYCMYAGFIAAGTAIEHVSLLLPSASRYVGTAVLPRQPEPRTVIPASIDSNIHKELLLLRESDMLLASFAQPLGSPTLPVMSATDPGELESGARDVMSRVVELETAIREENGSDRDVGLRMMLAHLDELSGRSADVAKTIRLGCSISMSESLPNAVYAMVYRAALRLPRDSGITDLFWTREVRMLQLLEFRRQMFLEWQQQTQASLSSSIWLSELPELHLLFTAVDLILYGESANRIRRLANDVNRFRDNAEISDTPASRMLVVDETELRNIETRCIFSDAYVAQYVERADLPDTALTNETYVRRVLTDLCVSMSVMDSEAEFFSRCVFAGISSETHFLTSREAGIVAIAQKAARTPGKDCVAVALSVAKATSFLVFAFAVLLRLTWRAHQPETAAPAVSASRLRRIQSKCWNRHCGRFGTEVNPLRYCSGCKLALYCSRECQQSAWPSHKDDCLAHRPKRDADAQ